MDHVATAIGWPVISSRSGAAVARQAEIEVIARQWFVGVPLPRLRAVGATEPAPAVGFAGWRLQLRSEELDPWASYVPGSVSKQQVIPGLSIAFSHTTRRAATAAGFGITRAPGFAAQPGEMWWSRAKPNYQDWLPPGQPPAAAARDPQAMPPREYALRQSRTRGPSGYATVGSCAGAGWERPPASNTFPRRLIAP